MSEDYNRFGPGKAGTVEIIDDGLSVAAGGVSAFGEQLVAQLTPVAGWKFNYGLIDDMATVTLTGSGSSAISGGRMQLNTTAATNSSAEVKSKATARYTPGIGIVHRFTHVFQDGVTGSEQIAGIGESADGLFLGYNGDEFGIMRRRDSVDTWIALDDWNGYKPDGEAGRFLLDPTLGNVYQIRFQWLGYGAIRFYVENPATGKLVLVHTIKYANTSADTSILNPTLPAYAKVSNTTNNTAITNYTPSAMAFMEGYNPNHDLIHPLDYHRPLFGEKTVTTEVPVLSIQAGTALNGVTSRITSSLGVGTFTGDGNKPVIFRIYKGGTVLGASYTAFDVTNSTLLSDTAGTALSGGTLVDNTFIGATDAARVDFHNIGIKIFPSEIITVTAETQVSQVVDVGLNMVERF